MDDIKLPPPALARDLKGSTPVYTEDTVRALILADRQRRGEPVGRVRVDSGEVHIVPRIRDADVSGLRDGQMVYAAPQPAIPEGMVLVPVEPSDEFVRRVTNHGVWTAQEVRNLYDDIIAAAPQPKEGGR